VLLGSLPRGFALPIAVVQHLDPHHSSMLSDILRRRTALTVQEAIEGEHLAAGTAYIAPPDKHLTIAAGGVIELSMDAPLHYLRPAADRLFSSAAAACGPTIAIVLTGTGSDGTEGIPAIKAAGGIVIVQDEASSAFFGMPQAAIQTGLADFVLPLGEIATQLMQLAGARHDRGEAGTRV
jgi:two-component system chemotaxis response regulator CheB